MAKSESSKKKFGYEQVENIDAVFNYLSMVNKGLKNRHLSLGDDGQLLELSLPDQVKLTIKAQVKSTKGSLAIELDWEMPDDALLEDSDDEALASQEADEEKAERKAREKAEKKAEKLRLKAAEQAVKLAAKEAEKAAKEIKAAEKAAANAEKLLQKGTEIVEEAVTATPPDRTTPRQVVKPAAGAKKLARKTTKNKQPRQNKAAKKPKSKAVSKVQDD